MNHILRNVLAVVAGLVVGNVVNGFLVSISGSVIPLPEGVDPNDMESLKAAIPDFPPKNFIMPFLAHALGTLFGALVTSLIGVSHQLKLAVGIGGFFLLGGIAINIMLPGPIWFTALDIAIAYIPMAFLGHVIATKLNR